METFRTKLQPWSTRSVSFFSPNTFVPVTEMWSLSFSTWWVGATRFRIHPDLVLRLFASTLIAISHTFLIYALSCVGFNARWLAACLLLFLMEISFWFTANFSKTKLGRKIGDACIWNVTSCSSVKGPNILEKTSVSLFKIEECCWNIKSQKITLHLMANPVTSVNSDPFVSWQPICLSLLELVL